MKVLLLVLSIVTFGFGAFAQTSETEANWFSPACKDKCPKMLTPGTASLGNDKGVFRPGGKSKKKTTAPQTFNVDQ